MSLFPAELATAKSWGLEWSATPGRGQLASWPDIAMIMRNADHKPHSFVESALAYLSRHPEQCISCPPKDIVR
jgi:hypothetical protein